ncbi:hypothetical protein BLOT_007051 [Blomia tropicalis]|nr:hypothetical protein BLOT_007051 [Blomia tropicalis]
MFRILDCVNKTFLTQLIKAAGSFPSILNPIKDADYINNDKMNIHEMVAHCSTLDCIRLH